jgi:hypothetical protein
VDRLTATATVPSWQVAEDIAASWLPSILTAFVPLATAIQLLFPPPEVGSFKTQPFADYLVEPRKNADPRKQFNVSRD